MYSQQQIIFHTNKIQLSSPKNPRNTQRLSLPPSLYAIECEMGLAQKDVHSSYFAVKGDFPKGESEGLVGGFPRGSKAPFRTNLWQRLRP